MNTFIFVRASSLGKCKHCKSIIVGEMIGRGKDDAWRCPNPACGKELTYQDFGFEPKADNPRILERKRHINEFGEWTNREPASSTFALRVPDIMVWAIVE